MRTVLNWQIARKAGWPFFFFFPEVQRKDSACVLKCNSYLDVVLLIKDVLSQGYRHQESSITAR